MNTAAALRVKTAGLWLAILAGLIVGAVLVMQYGYGYAPCKLCLTERLPYYAAVPLGLLVRRTMLRVWRHRMFFEFIRNRIGMILEMQRRGLHADAERHRAEAARLVAEYQVDPAGFLSRWKLPWET